MVGSTRAGGCYFGRPAVRNIGSGRSGEDGQQRRQGAKIMRRHIGSLVVFGVAAVATSSFAANLNLTVREATSGLSNISVAPGAVVEYEVVGQLSDTNNGGLALWGADLDFDGGDLTAADIPTEPPMNNFTPLLGISNPYGPCPAACGYGGTIIAGNLVQCGGGQNTINNTDIYAPYPIGTVIENVGHTAVVLLTGALTAPVVEGEYHLRILTGSVFGNQIKFGEDAVPFWATEAFGEGTLTELVITVGCGIDLASSIYGCDATLPRFQKNTIRLTFTDPITLPPAGAIEIRQLLAGDFGATNHASSFLMSIESGNTLKLVENGNILTNGVWYAVMYRGSDWTGVCNFERDYAKVAGDADNTGINDFADLSFIFGNQTGAAGDTDRSDVNGDTFVDFADISDAFGFNGSFAAAKPSGHGCTPIP
jgi:hypothetical protein